MHFMLVTSEALTKLEMKINVLKIEMRSNENSINLSIPPTVRGSFTKGSHLFNVFAGQILWDTLQQLWWILFQIHFDQLGLQIAFHFCPQSPRCLRIFVHLMQFCTCSIQSKKLLKKRMHKNTCSKQEELLLQMNKNGPMHSGKSLFSPKLLWPLLFFFG